MVSHNKLSKLLYLKPLYHATSEELHAIVPLHVNRYLKELNDKNYFDKALFTPFEQLDNVILTSLRNILSECETCYDCIIENLIDEGLIPSEQMDIAQELIRIAN